MSKVYCKNCKWARWRLFPETEMVPDWFCQMEEDVDTRYAI